MFDADMFKKYDVLFSQKEGQKSEFTREIKLQMYGDELTNPDTFTQPLPPGMTIMDLQDLYNNVLNIKKLVQERIPPTHPKYNELMHQSNVTATNMKRAFGEENLVGKKKVLPHSRKPKNSYLDELKKLAEFKNKGLITAEEFDIKKKEILGI